MARKKKNEVVVTSGEFVSREEVATYLADIAAKIVESDRSYMHSAIALDQIMRLPNSAEVMDADLKQQAKDLWVKIKSTGLHLSDPPMLYGVPEFSDNNLRKADGEAEDDSEAIVIEIRPSKEDSKRGAGKQSRKLDDDDDFDDDFDDDDDDDDSDDEENKI